MCKQILTFFIDSEANDASSFEGRRREEPCTQRGDHRGGGAPRHPETVLPSYSREEFHISVERWTLCCPLTAQRHDGAEEVLQPSFPN